MVCTKAKTSVKHAITTEAELYSKKTKTLYGLYKRKSPSQVCHFNKNRALYHKTNTTDHKLEQGTGLQSTERN